MSAADKEVRTKSDVVIERETARKWAARAIACIKIFARRPPTGRNLAWYERFVIYKHEAIEHAASASPSFADKIRRQIERVQFKRSK